MQVVKRTDPPFCYTPPGRTAVRGRVAGSRRRGRAVTGARQTRRTRTSNGWVRPRSVRWRVSSDRSRSAASADAALTRISPGPAAEASRAVTFTLSPSAVKSVDGIADRADVGEPGVDAGTQRDPWSGLASVAGGPQEFHGGVDRMRRVVVTGQDRQEQPDHLVADELVDDAVACHEAVRRLPVEPAQEVLEGARSHRLREAGRPTHVREEQAELDLGAAAGLLQLLEAEAADRGILVPAPAVEQPHERCARSGERGRAHLAAGRARQHPEEPTPRGEPRIGVVQHSLPHRVGHEGRRFAI